MVSKYMIRISKTNKRMKDTDSNLNMHDRNMKETCFRSWYLLFFLMNTSILTYWTVSKSKSSEKEKQGV